MLCLRTGSFEYVAVPIKITKVAVLTFVVGIDPRPVRILGLVVPAVVEHLHLLVRVVPGVVALAGMECELIGEVHIVITGRDEVRACGVESHTSTAVVGYFQVSGLSALGGDENNTG